MKRFLQRLRALCTWRVFFVTAIGLAVTLAGVLAALYVYVQTPHFAGVVQRQLNARLDLSPKVKIQVENLGGRLPFHITADAVYLRDEDGDWMRILGVDARVSGRALIRGQIHAHSVAADTVDWIRLPEEDPPPPSEPMDHPELPSLPNIRVDELRAPEVILGEALFGHRAVYSVEGHAAPPGQGSGFLAELTVTRTDGPAEAVRAVAGIHGRPAVLEADVSLLDMAPDGLIAHLIRYGPETPQFHIRALGPLQGLEAEFSVSTADLGEAGGAITLALEDRVRIDTDIHAAVNPDRLPENLRELLADRAHLQASAAILPGETVELSALSLAAAGGGVTGQGHIDLEADTLTFSGDVRHGDLSRLNGAAGIELAGSALAHWSVEGPLRDPSAWIQATVDSLAVNELRFGAITAEAETEALMGDTASARITATDFTAGDASVAGVSLEAVAADLRGALSLDLEAAAEGLLFGDIALPSATAAARAVLADAWEDGFPGMEATLAAVATGFTPPWDGAAPVDIDLRAAATSADLDAFTITGLEVRGPGAEAVFAGTALREALSLEGELRLAVDDAAALPLPAFDAPLPERASLRADVRANGQERTADALFTGGIEGLGALPDPVPALTGGAVNFEGEASFNEAGVLEAALSRFEGQHFHASANAALDFPEETLDADWEGRIANLAPAAAAAQRDLQGALDFSGSVVGPLDALEFRLEATGEGLAIEGQTLETARLEASLREIPERPSGELSLALSQAGETLTADAVFSLDDGVLRLPTLEAAGPGVSLTGALEANLETRLTRGDLSLSVADFAALTPFTGEPLEGWAEVEAALAPEDGQQSLDVVWSAGEVESRWLRAASAEGRAVLANLFGQPGGDIVVNGEGLAFGEVSIDTVAVEASGDAGAFTFAAETRGAAQEPFGMDTSGGLTVDWPDFALNLAEFDGYYGELPIALDGTLALAREGGVFEAAPATLRLHTATLTAGGRLDSETVAFEAALADLDLALLQGFGAPPVEGVAEFRIQASGAADAPRIDLRLDIADLTVDSPTPGEAPPITARLDARLDEGMLQARGGVRGPQEARADAAFDMPVSLSLQPWAVDVAEDAPLQGRLDAVGDLETVTTLLLLDDQLITGVAQAAFTLEGTAADPIVAGSAAITEANYEHLEHGTLLRDITVRATAENGRIVLEQAEMTDGGTGSIAATGAIDLAPADGFPFNVAVQLRNAVLVRRDDLTAAVGGVVHAGGSLDDMRVVGNLTGGPVTFYIPDRLPAAQATTLDVIEVNRPGVAPVPDETIPAPGGAAAELPLRLDVRVNFPGRVFVRGRGLDSEWQGNLRVRGPASEPHITGDFSVVRGQFSFLEHRFNLAESAISLDGTPPLSPMLNINAVNEGRDMTARLALTGPADAPHIALESEPPLPQDEILSRLLFGRSVSNITPMQGLRLANAANTLAGGTGALDFMAQTRRVLGVDQLDIRPTGDDWDDATVALGTYLTEDIFLQLEQGLGADTGRMLLEIELRPNLVVDSEVGADAQGGLGVSWKRDY